MAAIAVASVREFVQCEVGRPFLWGESDCVSLVLRGLAFLGFDVPAPDWTSKRTALRAYQATGGPVQYFREAGWTRVSVSQAKTGDVLVLPRQNADGFPGVGLVAGRGYLSSTHDRGVRVTALARAGGPAYALSAP